jgi:hypothetical protein
MRLVWNNGFKVQYRDFHGMNYDQVSAIAYSMLPRSFIWHIESINK